MSQCKAECKMDMAHGFSSHRCTKRAIKDGLCTIHQPHYVSPRSLRFFDKLTQKAEERERQAAIPRKARELALCVENCFTNADRILTDSLAGQAMLKQARELLSLLGEDAK